MGINRNMAFFYGVTIAFVTLAAIVAIWGIYSLNDAFVSLHAHEITTKIETIKIARDVNYVSRLTRNIMLGSEYEEDMRELEATAAHIATSFQTLAEATHDANDKKLVEQSRLDTMAFVDDSIRRMKSIKDIPANLRSKAYLNYKKEATPLAMKSRASSQAVIQHADTGFEAGNKHFEKTIRRTFIFIAGAGILIVVFFQLSTRHFKERNIAEAARIKAHLELEQRIAERTLDLVATNRSLLEKIEALKNTESILRESRDNAVQAGKLAVLGQMSAGISHEISQPLTAIQTFTSNSVNLLEHGRIPEVVENLGMIRRMTDRIGVIVAEIKSFSRKSPAEKQRISIVNAIHQAIMLVEPRRRQIDAVIDVQPFQETVRVWADSVRFEQVLVNLLRNALDAVADLPVRHIAVTVTPCGSEVRIVVKDTGHGIPEAVFPHLFESFFTTKQTGQGLGLGLAISQMIITGFGGKLTAQNHDAGGAEFTVALEAVTDGKSLQPAG